MNINRLYKRLIIFILCLLLAPVSMSQKKIPESLSLEYEFELASIPLGLIEKRLSFSQGIYTADSTIKPNGVAKLLFSGELEETSTFKVEDNNLVSLSFHAVRKNYKPYDRKAVFNQKDNTVSYNSGESETLRENTFDLGSFPFAFMLEDLNAIENKVYEVNTGKDYSTYVVMKPKKEKINTPAGEFNTTKITLKRQDSDNRFYYVWLADETHYPVKIVRDKKGKLSTLTLKSVHS